MQTTRSSRRLSLLIPPPAPTSSSFLSGESTLVAAGSRKRRATAESSEVRATTAGDGPAASKLPRLSDRLRTSTTLTSVTPLAQISNSDKKKEEEELPQLKEGVYTRSTRKTPLGSSNLVNQVTRSTAAATVGGKKAAIGNTRGSTGRAALPVSPSVGTPVKKKVMPSTNANTATTTPIKSTRSSDKGTATSTPVAAASSLAAVKAGNTPVINTNAPPKTPISKITTTNNNSNIAATPKTPHQILQETKSQFRRCATPKKLVGRVEERKVITNFWKQTVISGKSGSIYISGCPGTGKTALLDEIIRDTSTERKMAKHFVKIVKINCMSVNDPKHIYGTIAQGFLKETVPARDAPALLDHLFVDAPIPSKKKKASAANAPSKTMHVVILDEIDFLITRDQDILYKLFEWPCLENSNMVLIGIANALDMTSRFLPRLKAKQYDPQLLNFRPYEVDEIKEIILERLKIARNSSNDTDDNDMNTITNVEVQSSSTTASAPPEFIMQPSAVEFCARKLVGMGDLRKTLDICRRAIEVAEAEHRQKEKEEEDYKKQMKQDTNNSNDTNTTVTDTNQTQSLPSVTVKHVMQVANAALGSISSNATAVRESTTHQKIALIALLLLERGKKEDLNLGKWQERYFALCADKQNNLNQPISRGEFMDTASFLEQRGLVAISGGGSGGSNSGEVRKKKVKLSIHPDDVKAGVQDVIMLKNALERETAKLR